MTWHEITMRVINGVLNLGGAKISSVEDGVANDDVATVGQVKARTPQVTVGPTPPSDPDTNDLWVIT